MAGQDWQHYWEQRGRYVSKLRWYARCGGQMVHMGYDEEYLNGAGRLTSAIYDGEAKYEIYDKDPDRWLKKKCEAADRRAAYPTMKWPAGSTISEWWLRVFHSPGNPHTRTTITRAYDDWERHAKRQRR